MSEWNDASISGPIILADSGSDEWESSDSDTSGNSGTEDEEIHVVIVNVETAKENSEVVEKPKRPRKRQNNESKWQRRKRLRNSEISIRDLNVRLMYNLYKDFCSEKDVLPVTEDIYRLVINTEFNILFHAPNKDTCSNCDKYKFAKENLDDEAKLKILETEHEVHLRKVESARYSMKKDAEKSKTDSTSNAMTFDLQKALPFPKMTLSVVYYKMNMYVYNLECHEVSSDLGFMYVCDDTTALRGPQEISSCVIKHTESRASDVPHNSDTCTSQNRNWNLTLALMKLLQSDNNKIEIVDHKFIESLYKAPRTVTTMKKQDMYDILSYMPPIRHWYFNNLVTTEVDMLLMKKQDMCDILSYMPPIRHWYFNNLVTTEVDVVIEVGSLTDVEVVAADVAHGEEDVNP
ncbi:hypothetical protein PR048_024250 [Dryococelus australis]|uniref:Uncharacterized protein n=1 Tax=Dryococelus australis TaxID=614101 RepID=A0ABQ9GN51_9NEOP|nr:hypothetical protein PR048_024250 [Dryococelus australis]